MNITSCDIWPVRLTLQEPFSIAYMTIDHAVNVFMRIHTDEGIIGYGCGGPDEEVTGEHWKTIAHALTYTAEPLLIGEDPLNGTHLMQTLYAELSDQPTALNTVDMALMDIAAKKADMPLYQYLGGRFRPTDTSITIGIQPFRETLDKAADWKRQGFKRLKLKGGQSIEEDIEKILRLREHIGYEVDIVFDANQGYTLEEAKQCISALAGIKALFIEQPCLKTELSAFSLLRSAAQGMLPIMADESTLGPEDTLELIIRGSADLYNIKLAKTGGIRRAMQMDAIASAAGKKTMMGSMDEAALGIAAGLHTLLASPNCIYADLDGSLEFTDDPSQQAVILKNGQLIPHRKPGLGIDL